MTAPALAPGLDGLFVVADGVGGRQAGATASGEVVHIFRQLFSSDLYRDRVGYSPDREDYYVVVLKEVLEQLNEHLYNLSGSQPELQGMGTTASVALLVGGQLYVGHVGDSRVYHWRNSVLTQLTHDDSWVAEQVESGAMSSEMAANHPNRNIITACLGNSLILRVERAVYTVQPGDVLLLSSDGLTNLVTDNELAHIVTSTRAPQAVCDYLVDLANKRGGPDNITVVIAQIGPEDGARVTGGHASASPRETSRIQKAETLKIVPRQQGEEPAIEGQPADAWSSSRWPSEEWPPENMQSELMPASSAEASPAASRSIAATPGSSTASKRAQQRVQPPASPSDEAAPTRRLSASGRAGGRITRGMLAVGLAGTISVVLSGAVTILLDRYVGDPAVTFAVLFVAILIAFFIGYAVGMLGGKSRSSRGGRPRSEPPPGSK